MATAKQTPEFTLQIRRTFAAPREKVFAAWARREQLEQWMCKDESAHTVIHHEQDIRIGGRYKMEVCDPGKGETYWGQGLYREVKPPEKIVFTWSWTKDTPDGAQLHPDSPETQVTVETDLIASGFDSLSLVSLLVFVEQTYGLWIPQDEINETNLKDIRALAAVVVRLLNERQPPP